MLSCLYVMISGTARPAGIGHRRIPSGSWPHRPTPAVMKFPFSSKVHQDLDQLNQGASQQVRIVQRHRSGPAPHRSPSGKKLGARTGRGNSNIHQDSLPLAPSIPISTMARTVLVAAPLPAAFVRLLKTCSTPKNLSFFRGSSERKFPVEDVAYQAGCHDLLRKVSIATEKPRNRIPGHHVADLS